jgi:hypothetical protein
MAQKRRPTVAASALEPDLGLAAALCSGGWQCCGQTAMIYNHQGADEAFVLSYCLSLPECFCGIPGLIHYYFCYKPKTDFSASGNVKSEPDFAAKCLCPASTVYYHEQNKRNTKWWLACCFGYCYTVRFYHPTWSEAQDDHDGNGVPIVPAQQPQRKRVPTQAFSCNTCKVQQPHTYRVPTPVAEPDMQRGNQVCKCETMVNRSLGHLWTEDEAARTIQGLWRTSTARKQVLLLLSSVFEKVLDPASGVHYYFTNVPGKPRGTSQYCLVLVILSIQNGETAWQWQKA